MLLVQRDSQQLLSGHSTLEDESFCTETNPTTNLRIISAVSMLAAAKAYVGTGTTLMPEQAASCAKKKEPLEKLKLARAQLHLTTAFVNTTSHVH